MRLRDIVGAPSYLKHEGGCASCPRKRMGFTEARIQESSVMVVYPSPPDDMRRDYVGSLLRGAGIQHYSETYLVHCPPSGTKPTPRETACCMRQMVMEEVRGYPLVLLLGSAPVSAFFPKYSSKKLLGNAAYHPDYPGQRFLYTYMPRGDGPEPTVTQHFGRASRLLQGTTQDFTLYTQGHPEFDARLKQCLANPWYSLDVETQGLQSWRPDRSMTSFSLAIDDTWAVSVGQEDSVWIGAVHGLIESLQDRSRKVIGFNLGFDLDWIEQETGRKVLAEGLLDVQSLYYLYKAYKEMSLKELVSLEGDGYAHLLPWPMYTGWPQELLLRYNAEDVIHPIKLYRAAITKLNPTAADLFIRAIGGISFATRKITVRGMTFLADNWRASQKEVEASRAEEIQGWRAKCDAFDPDKHLAGNGLIEYIYTIKQYPVVQSTKKGKPSTDENAIRTLIDEHGADELEHLIAIKKLEKLRSTYIDPIPDLVDFDGRVHPSFITTSTDTGRLSSRDPNFQNQPRGPLIRRLYGAQLGLLLGEGDLSQIELRIAASLANDVQVIQQYNEGIDLHTQTAMRALGAQRVTSEQRTRAKAINFALLYGGSWEGLQAYAATQYGVRFTDAEAKRFCHLFFTEVFPAGKEWHRRTDQELIDNKGHAHTAVGQYHYYDGWDSNNQSAKNKAFRSHLNSKCQGPAGQMMNMILVIAQRRLAQRDVDAHFVNTVHDSALFEVPPDQFDDTVYTLQAVAQEVKGFLPWFKVPMIMDFKVAHPDSSWGSLRDWPLEGR